MQRLISLIAAAIFACLASVSAASADAQYSKSDGLWRLARSNNSTVCCVRNGQAWWSDWNRCQAAGGYPGGNEACRYAGNGGYNDGYNGGYNDGYQDPYNNPDRRVCCSSNYGIGWSTWRQCRQARGQDVMNKVCRKQKHGFDYNYLGQGGNWGGGYGQDPYNNPERRVCCNSYYGTTWSSWRECRRVNGQEVMNKFCRR